MLNPVSVSGVRRASSDRGRIGLAVVAQRCCLVTTSYGSIGGFEVKRALLARRVPKENERGKQRFRMSHIDPTSTRCTLGPGLTVERRIATALWNEHERERIIAMKAHEVFCSRGCDHGFDLDDWLKAEQELSSQPHDVLISQSEAGFDISVAGRAEQICIVLSIAPSNLLILWTKDDMDTSEQDTNIHSTLSLALLPGTVDPERADVTFRDDRVWLHLPHVDNGHSPSEPDAAVPGGDGRARRK
jgi:Protein of unknown function (DUF2934)